MAQTQFKLDFTSFKNDKDFFDEFVSCCGMKYSHPENNIRVKMYLKKKEDEKIKKETEKKNGTIKKLQEDFITRLTCDARELYREKGPNIISTSYYVIPCTVMDDIDEATCREAINKVCETIGKSESKKNLNCDEIPLPNSMNDIVSQIHHNYVDDGTFAFVHFTNPPYFCQCCTKNHKSLYSFNTVCVSICS